MRPLALLLIVKIAVTAVVVAVPNLLFPLGKLLPGAPAGGLLVLFRLYGIAILALLVGYGVALQEVFKNRFPRGLIFMGLVSNAGAVAVVLAFGGRHAIDGGMIFFASIAFLLLLSLIRPDLAMRNLGRER